MLKSVLPPSSVHEHAYIPSSLSCIKIEALFGRVISGQESRFEERDIGEEEPIPRRDHTVLTLDITMTHTSTMHLSQHTHIHTYNQNGKTDEHSTTKSRTPLTHKGTGRHDEEQGRNEGWMGGTNLSDGGEELICKPLLLDVREEGMRMKTIIQVVRKVLTHHERRLQRRKGTKYGIMLITASLCTILPQLPLPSPRFHGGLTLSVSSTFAKQMMLGCSCNANLPRISSSN